MLVDEKFRQNKKMRHYVQMRNMGREKMVKEESTRLECMDDIG